MPSTSSTSTLEDIARDVERHGADRRAADSALATVVLKLESTVEKLAESVNRMGSEVEKLSTILNGDGTERTKGIVRRLDALESAEASRVWYLRCTYAAVLGLLVKALIG